MVVPAIILVPIFPTINPPANSNGSSLAYLNKFSANITGFDKN